MIRSFAILATLAVLGLLGTLYFITSNHGPDDQFAQCRASAVAGGAGQIGGQFTLVDETGTTVTSEQVLDQPSLIYFGYTFCPDVCPMDTARNAEAIEILEDRGSIVKPVFITIDPDRDTAEVLAEFTEYQHPRMVGLTGSAEQIKAASQAYRTYYKKQDPEEGAEDYYLVDHSTFSYLTLPDHGFVEFFRRDLSPEVIADRVACFVDAS